MSPEAAELDKSDTTIREMFGAVAPRYDFLNRLLSARRDVAWRRLAASRVADGPPGPILDLCCGTGDLALAVGEHGRSVVAADFCLPMLALAERKYERLKGPTPAGLAADALRLPFPRERFAGLTVAFGLRNVSSLDTALAEMGRTLLPGGHLAVLEFAVPRRRWLRRAYLLYFEKLLPRIGALFSARGAAYRYLPDSVVEFPQREDFVNRLRVAGFVNPAWQDLSGGIVCLYTASRST
jgi:demethylmenaquinone methyltransferase/2-methoxy-6-polyprenyl-1,4-benzoquinol methylase